MIYNPHNYQEYAINFINKKEIAALLLDMGLGKTSITLTSINDLMFDYFDVSKVLVIAPLRVATSTWPEEIKKWDHLKDLEISVVVGDLKTRKAALAKRADIYIINRENIQWLIEKSGYRFDFDMVIIDELSSFKSWKSKRFQSLMKVRPRIKRIVGLTGTPASNGLMDLFAEYKVLDMGARLGKFIGGYRNEYFVPDKRNGEIIYSYKPRVGADKLIYNRVRDITISLKSEDHLHMPDLVSTEYKVYLDDKEMKIYNELENELAIDFKSGEVTAGSAGVLCGKLSQMANGAIYLDDGDVFEFHQKKLDALEDIIEAANGKSLLIAYWYRHDLDRIKERLNSIKVDYKEIDTDKTIKEWNEGKIPVGLIHPASAGHGLNLQAGGSTLVWFGLTWSLELYQQTVARLYRQGQKDKTVVVIHIIANDTIDENIMKALKNKDMTQSKLIEAVKARIGGAK